MVYIQGVKILIEAHLPNINNNGLKDIAILSVLWDG